MPWDIPTLLFSMFDRLVLFFEGISLFFFFFFYLEEETIAFCVSDGLLFQS